MSEVVVINGHPMTLCGDCHGYGIYESWSGDGPDVVDCGCWGGYVRARDERGRFISLAQAGEVQS